MKHTLSNQQKFLQKMALTPQMRQSINMLGMSVSDLAEYIDFAATQNPFLQKILDAKAASKYSQRSAGQDSDSSYDDEDRTKSEENPRFALLSQVKMTGASDEMSEIAEYLIFEMDDNGYISINPEDAAHDLGVDVDDVLECIDIIQGLEPAGIGAADITECLQLQLKRKGMSDSLEYKIVSSYLAEVAREEIDKLALLHRTNKEEIKKAIANIKRLNPRPASSILAKGAEKVIPELTARIDKKKVQLELNRGAVPGLKLYNPYENDFNIVKDPEARKFMRENINAAKHLIDNLKRREDTLCKVANYIVSYQSDSLSQARDSIKTLTIKDVAKAVNFHPSTVSRAVSHKFIKINDEVRALTSLLSHGMKKENGELQSKTDIRMRIAALVKNEDPACPLTDDQISGALKSEGIVLSRRTVVKYRNMLRILPAFLRKKSKASPSPLSET